MKVFLIRIFYVLYALWLVPTENDKNQLSFDCGDHDNRIIIASGDKDSSYYKIVDDILEYCHDYACHYNIKSNNHYSVKTIKPNNTSSVTHGGFHNLELLKTNDADAGMVPLDVLIDRGEEGQHYENLKSLLALGQQAMHIIVLDNGNFKTLRDLKGETIGVWSSSIISFSIVNKIIHITDKIKSSYGDKQEALDELKAGHISAFIAMAVPTAPWIKALNDNEVIYKIIGYNSLYILDIIDKKGYYQDIELDYSKLQNGKIVDTISSESELLGNIDSIKKNKYSDFQKCVNDHLGSLKGRHDSFNRDVKDVLKPKWQPYQN